MGIILAILFCIFLYLIMRAIEDVTLFNKFKIGYTFELYKLKFYSTDTYDFVCKYKIVTRKDRYILVQEYVNNEYDELKEFDIYELVTKTDKIIIRDNNGIETDIIFKIEPYQW